MKLTYKQIKEATALNNKGVAVENLATIYNTSSSTMARYLRAYHRYGESFWSRFPMEKNHD